MGLTVIVVGLNLGTVATLGLTRIVVVLSVGTVATLGLTRIVVDLSVGTVATLGVTAIVVGLKELNSAVLERFILPPVAKIALPRLIIAAVSCPLIFVLVIKLIKFLLVSSKPATLSSAKAFMANPNPTVFFSKAPVLSIISFCRVELTTDNLSDMSFNSLRVCPNFSIAATVTRRASSALQLDPTRSDIPPFSLDNMLVFLEVSDAIFISLT